MLASPLAAKTPEEVAAAALKAAPIWDGHNDVGEQLRERRRDVIAGFDFNDTTHEPDGKDGTSAMQTDLPRLAKGHIGAEFWSVYVSADQPEPQAAVATIEQIDVMKRLIARYPDRLQLALTSADVERAMKAGKIASLIGMEGGHSIDGSLGVLRQMYALGARYMTLAHFKNNAWADSATDDPKHDGLTDFGKDVVREMQRLGMLVDLAHVSEATMNDALDVAKAPLIFSHSGARAVDGASRNVPDAVLERVKANGGIVMAVAYPSYVSEALRHWEADDAAETGAREGPVFGPARQSQGSGDRLGSGPPGPEGDGPAGRRPHRSPSRGRRDRPHRPWRRFRRDGDGTGGDGGRLGLSGPVRRARAARLFAAGPRKDLQPQHDARAQGGRSLCRCAQQ